MAVSNMRGWFAILLATSPSCRVGIAPTEDQHLSTAHISEVPFSPPPENRVERQGTEAIVRGVVGAGTSRRLPHHTWSCVGSWFFFSDAVFPPRRTLIRATVVSGSKPSPAAREPRVNSAGTERTRPI